jgi:hypothetical protein
VNAAGQCQFLTAFARTLGSSAVRRSIHSRVSARFEPADGVGDDTAGRAAGFSGAGEHEAGRNSAKIPRISARNPSCPLRLRRHQQDYGFRQTDVDWTMVQSFAVAPTSPSQLLSFPSTPELLNSPAAVPGSSWRRPDLSFPIG